jgi:hypothetical protein
LNHVPAGRRKERIKSGGGPPQSKTLARYLVTPGLREASWSAPVLWRFQPLTTAATEDGAHLRQYQGEKLQFTRRGANHSKLFRAELEVAQRTFAGAIFDELSN